MEESVQQFRSAFHGFNREDVVRFIEEMTARHYGEVSRLQDDLRRVHAELDARQESNLLTENETLKGEKAGLEAKNAELQAQVEALEARLTDPEPPDGSTDWTSEELAAYRRAESVERQARERAAHICRQADSLVAGLAARMDSSHQNMTDAAEALGKALDGLQAALDLAQATLHDGAEALRQLHPDESAGA